MLLLAAAARPAEFEVATVDHGLRIEAHGEAREVAALCRNLGVTHSTLAIDWSMPPTSAIQEQARTARYGALAAWMREHGLVALLTAHHLDDQAETLVMRLNRGAGVRGLAGMRRASTVPGAPDLLFLRPLLHWHRSELKAVCTQTLVEPATDSSNEDDRHERVRVRRALAGAEWIDPASLARSAENLAAADDALTWAADREWSQFVEAGEGEIIYRPSTAPAEILRRVVARVIAELGTEGFPGDLRGRELDRLIASLQAGKTATLRGVRCAGGDLWLFAPAAARSKETIRPHAS